MECLTPALSCFPGAENQCGDVKRTWAYNLKVRAGRGTAHMLICLLENGPSWSGKGWWDPLWSSNFREEGSLSAATSQAHSTLTSQCGRRWLHIFSPSSGVGETWVQLLALKSWLHPLKDLRFWMSPHSVSEPQFAHRVVGRIRDVCKLPGTYRHVINSN